MDKRSISLHRLVWMLLQFRLASASPSLSRSWRSMADESGSSRLQARVRHLLYGALHSCRISKGNASFNVEDQEDLRGVLRDPPIGLGYRFLEAGDGEAGVDLRLVARCLVPVELRYPYVHE